MASNQTHDSVYEALHQYDACDISDALLKLGVPGAGFLADIGRVSSTTAPASRRIIAPASTVLFAPKLFNIVTYLSLPSNVSAGTPYADLTTPGTIVIVSQPQGQRCAVVGGINAQRMAVMGAKGVLVDGRVRDLSQVSQIEGFDVWARSTSTVATAAEAKPWAVNVPIRIGVVHIEPGDIIMLDPSSAGAVAIPLNKLSAVLELLPKLKAADDKVMEDVLNGVDCKTAFKRHRGNL